MSECIHERMVMEVNQGCARGFNFTLQQKDKDTEVITPINLTGKSIMFNVKVAPYIETPSIIEKEITSSSDTQTIGSITSEANGQFTVQVTEEDISKFEPGEYALILRIKDGDVYTNIAGVGNNNAIFRVCHQ